MPGSLRWSLLLGVCSASFTVAGPVLAEAAEPTAVSAENTVGEVLVTASRRTENVQDVPMSVTAIGGERLAEQHVALLSDLAAIAPGLKFGEFGNTTNLSIRGVGTSFVSGGGESSAALHLNGVFLSNVAAYRMGTFDIGRVEVLKGPQGTLYGRNSTAGVISFYSAAPTKDFTGGGSFGIGNYDLRRGEAFVSGPVNDRVRVRLFVSGEDRDGYVLNTVTGQRLDDSHGVGGRLSVDADVTDWWTTELRASTRKEHTAGPAFDSYYPTFVIAGFPLSSVDVDPYRLKSPLRYGTDRHFYMNTATNTFRLSDEIQLVSITGATRFKFRSSYDTLGSSVGFSPLSAHSNSRTLSQEVLLKGTTSRLDWLAGLYYFEKRSNGANTTIPPFGVLQAGSSNGGQTSKSAFADVTYRLSDTTRVFGGARYIRESLFDRQLSRINPSPPSPLCPALGVARRLSDNAVTGRFGAQHDLNPDSMIYAQASRGYKAGGFAGSDCANQFKPETVNALEAGYKSQWLNHRLTFNAAAFYNKIMNLQLEQATFAGIPVVNAPRAHSYGVEFDTVWQATDRLRIDANLSLIQAEYDRFNAGDVGLGPPFPPASLKGNPLNNAPDASGLLGVEYVFPVAMGGDIKLRGEATATTKYSLREVIRPYTVNDGYVLGNLYATYRTEDRKLALTAWVKNVGDKAVLGGVLGFFGVIGTFGPPRTYGVDLRLAY